MLLILNCKLPTGAIGRTMIRERRKSSSKSTSSTELNTADFTKNNQISGKFPEENVSKSKLKLSKSSSSEKHVFAFGINVSVLNYTFRNFLFLPPDGKISGFD